MPSYASRSSCWYENIVSEFSLVRPHLHFLLPFVAEIITDIMMIVLMLMITSDSGEENQ